MNAHPPDPRPDKAADRDDAPLDVDIVDAIAAGVADEAVAEARREGLRRRLLRRVAADGQRHLTLAPDDAQWQRFAAGIQIQLLHRAGDTLSYLLRLEAGATLPPHRHAQDEECVVLEGRLRIGDALVVPAGGYHLARRGSLHAPIVAEVASTIFLRGALPDSADRL